MKKILILIAFICVTIVSQAQVTKVKPTIKGERVYYKNDLKLSGIRIAFYDSLIIYDSVTYFIKEWKIVDNDENGYYHFICRKPHGEWYYIKWNYRKKTLLIETTDKRKL